LEQAEQEFLQTTVDWQILDNHHHLTALHQRVEAVVVEPTKTLLLLLEVQEAEAEPVQEIQNPTAALETLQA
jgi:hypothetical protein